MRKPTRYYIYPSDDGKNPYAVFSSRTKWVAPIKTPVFKTSQEAHQWIVKYKYAGNEVLGLFYIY